MRAQLLDDATRLVFVLRDIISPPAGSVVSALHNKSPLCPQSCINKCRKNKILCYFQVKV